MQDDEFQSHSAAWADGYREGQNAHAHCDDCDAYYPEHALNHSKSYRKGYEMGMTELKLKPRESFRPWYAPSLVIPYLWTIGAIIDTIILIIRLIH